MKKLFLSILILTLISCVNNKQKNKLSVSQIPNTLSVEQKVYGLSTFWKEVSSNFVYLHKLDFSWDSVYKASISNVLETKNDYEYYRELERICALLKDGHTNVYYPKWKEDYITRSYFGNYLLKFKSFENKAYVVNTSVFAKKEIPIGSEIIQVDDKLVSEYLKSNVLPYVVGSTDYVKMDRAIERLLEGEYNTSVKITFKTPEGEIEEKLLKREKSKSKWYPVLSSKRSQFQWRTDSVGYLNINSFKNSERNKKLMEESYSDLKKAKGLIIDLRYNRGGSSSVGDTLASLISYSDTIYNSLMFARKHISLHREHQNSNEIDTLISPIKDDIYGNYSNCYWKSYGSIRNKNSFEKEDRILVPTVVLIGHNTASAAEDFLVMVDKEPHITVIGTRSFGSTGQPIHFDLPGGGRFRVCSKMDTYPNGKEFVGVGIEPDVYVQQTIEDILNYKDPVLQKALDLLSDKIKL